MQGTMPNNEKHVALTELHSRKSGLIIAIYIVDADATAAKNIAAAMRIQYRLSNFTSIPFAQDLFVMQEFLVYFMLFCYPPIPSPHFNMSAITSSILYARSDTRIIFLGHEPGPRETLITIMEISGTSREEERIAALEQKCREMDALIKGLLNELLDLKSVSMKLSRQAGEYRIQEQTLDPEPDTAPQIVASPAPVSADGTVMVRAKSQSPPAAPPEPEMVRIMQPDGTMKMEVRHGDQNTSGSSVGYGRDMKSSALRSAKKT
jgi:hypothetical protein